MSILLIKLELQSVSSEIKGVTFVFNLKNELSVRNSRDFSSKKVVYFLAAYMNIRDVVRNNAGVMPNLTLKTCGDLLDFNLNDSGACLGK